jgi:hypothetical protein
MDYDLIRLGSREFEHLTQALALRVLGGRTIVFGDGPDGGRDASFTGKVTWNPGNSDEDWDGYVVIQAKFRSRPLGTTDDTEWFLRNIESELKDWTSPDRRALKRGRRPEYLLLVTNVVLSGVPGRGGIDRVEALIKSFARQLSLNGWKVWHYDHLCRLIDNNDSVRKAFAGLIMPGDVLYRLHEYLDSVSINLAETMSRSVSMELIADQWVRLSQAGDTANSKLALSSVAVDLPIDKADSHGLHAASYIIKEGDRMLRNDRDAKERPHIVLVGGPGQGKTTIGQLVCQVYRAALLGEEPRVGLEEGHLLAACREGFIRVGLPTPVYRRWPVRVDLSAYSDATLGHSPMSLLRYVGQQVESRTSDVVSSSYMRNWLRDWPWLLVLDGLDEVPSAGARDKIMQGISGLLVEAARVNADIFIVATTRPQGYVGEFSEDQYEHINLAPLNPAQATVYARRLAEVRHANDPDMYTKLIMRTELAAKEEVTARLMRTPLQVTIMSLLLEGRERAPQARYALFEAYYHTIYAREVAKPGRLGKLLETQRNNVNTLHNRVGLLLQVQAEQGEAEASLPRDRLGELAAERLGHEGYEKDEAKSLADQIVTAVTRRLVLLVPKGLDEVGFEVRSIQEFMAARALVSGEDIAVIDRLREIVPSAHWRNTWLLAAGRIFAEREHMRGSLVSILGESDNSDELHLAVAPGADLALDMLEDDVALNAPHIRRMLASHALILMQRAPDESLVRRAAVLFNCATNDKVIRISVDQAIDQALQGAAAQRETARILLEIWQQQTGGLALRSRQALGRQETMERYSATGPSKNRTPFKPQTFAELLGPKLRQSDLPEHEHSIAEKFLKAFRGVTLPSDNSRLSATAILAEPAAANRACVDAALNCESIAAVVAGSYFDAAAETWAKASAIRSFMRTWLQRRAAGAAILAASTSRDLRAR